MKEFEPQPKPIVEKIPHPPQKDEDWEDDSEDISCDKLDHSERSRHNDTGQHDKHWKKYTDEED